MKNINPLHNQDNAKGQQEALSLVRSRIHELYAQTEQNNPEPKQRKSSELMDRFWQHHQDHPDKQAAWQTFYEGLPDHEKQQLWDEYHQADNTSQPAVAQQHEGEPFAEDTKLEDIETLPKTDKVDAKRTVYGEFVIPGEYLEQAEADEPAEAPLTLPKPEGPTPEITENSDHAVILDTAEISPIHTTQPNYVDSIRATKDEMLEKFKSKLPTKEASTPATYKRSKHHWAPLMISFTVGFLVLLAQYNQVIFALAKQYVSPGNSLHSPIIIDPNAKVDVGPESRIIIPKINVDIPVVYGLGSRDESAIQAALEDGVVHYHETAVPGQAGNNVIVGHSSNNFLNSGKYKFAFVLLDRLELNDTFILHYKGVRYVYKVTNKQVIEPTDFSLTTPTKQPTVTLITCTPPGTSWRRMVVQAQQISPTPTAKQIKATPASADIPSDTPEVVPGNSPSLLNRIGGWIF